MRLGLPWRHARAADVPGYDRLLLDFESLGDNCEFGLVQRCGGAEPLGLLRFASVALPHLLHALDTDFAAYGAGDDLEIIDGPLDYLFCRSRRYGFSYNTGDFASKTRPGAILARETRKVAYLKERFLADLAAGEKVFVRKGPETETLDALAPLLAALRRHGPAPLLRVRAAGHGQPPGAVSWRQDGLMEGAVERFAPYERASDIALEGWLDLCRNAWCLVRGLPEAPPPAGPDLLADPSGRPAALAHVLGPDGETLAARPVRALRADIVHAFSAWVWVPPAFEGARIAAELGRLHLGTREADLSRRGCWQRVWAAVRTGRRADEVRPRLVARGSPGAGFWSAGWRLEEGPVPAPLPAPSIAVPSVLEA